jgi:hypothetical protein
MHAGDIGHGRARAARSAAHVIGILHAGVFAALVSWSWLKWTDPLIDFGRELYVPWQITRGKVLFRDIESLFGPLSPYVNALLFELFGASLLTLVFVNVLLFAVIVAGIHRVLSLSTDRFTATAASLVAMLLFGFLPLGGFNFNFVTPYAHETTHGIALSVGLVLALHAAIAGRRPIWSALAGFAFGALVLTKPETSMAAAAAAFVAFAGVAAWGPAERPLLRSLLPVFATAALLLPLLFFAYFHRHMAAWLALEAVGGAWTAISETSSGTSAFYARVSGLDRPLLNGMRMILMFGAFLAYIGGMVALCRRAPDWRLLRKPVSLGAAMLLTLAPAMMPRFPSAFPLIALTAAGVSWVAFLRVRHHREAALRNLLLTMWCTFAVALLAKMALNVRTYHYGFYLALPAATVVVAVLCWFIPRGLQARASADAGRQFRRVSAVAIAVGIVPYLLVAQAGYRKMTISVGPAADRFLAAHTDQLWQGVAVRDALQTLESLATPDDTLAVLPEGIMLNYLARIDSPLRVINLMPPEYNAFGEDEVLQQLEAAPPRFVVLAHKNMVEYGYPPFGTDPRYGQRTTSWIKSRYRTVRMFGKTSTTPSGYGMELLELRKATE